jgi:hypothetical protein
MTDQEILEAFYKLPNESADSLLQIVAANLHSTDSKLARQAIEEALIDMHKSFGGFDEALMCYVPED